MNFNKMKVKVGSDYKISELTDFFLKQNYDKTNFVRIKGQFAIRGSIFDVYPLDKSSAYRLDFFGDKLDEVFIFNPSTQSNLKKIFYINFDNFNNIERPKGRISKKEIQEIIDRFSSGQSIYMICRAMKRKQSSIRYHLYLNKLISKDEARIELNNKNYTAKKTFYWEPIIYFFWLFTGFIGLIYFLYTIFKPLDVFEGFGLILLPINLFLISTHKKLISVPLTTSFLILYPKYCLIEIILAIFSDKI